MSVSRDQQTSSIGFLVGIGAWSISFITLIWAYGFYRMRTGAWLNAFITHSVFNQAILNTFALVLSSWVFHKFLKHKERPYFFLGHLFGALFVIGQIRMWSMLLQNGLSLKSSLAGSFFYLLTGFHAIHIVIGVLILLIVGMRPLLQGENASFNLRFDLALKFWDLLLVFWGILLLLIFFLK